MWRDNICDVKMSSAACANAPEGNTRIYRTFHVQLSILRLAFTVCGITECTRLTCFRQAGSARGLSNISANTANGKAYTSQLALTHNGTMAIRCLSHISMDIILFHSHIEYFEVRNALYNIDSPECLRGIIILS